MNIENLAGILVVAVHEAGGSGLWCILSSWFVDVVTCTAADPLRVTAVALLSSSTPRHPPVRPLLGPRTAIYPLRVTAVVSSSPSAPRHSAGLSWSDENFLVVTARRDLSIEILVTTVRRVVYATADPLRVAAVASSWPSAPRHSCFGTQVP